MIKYFTDFCKLLFPCPHTSRNGSVRLFVIEGGCSGQRDFAAAGSGEIFLGRISIPQGNRPWMGGLQPGSALLFCLEKSTGISAWKTGNNQTAKAPRQGRPPSLPDNSADLLLFPGIKRGMLPHPSIISLN